MHTARARWAAAYREARKVRQFDRRFMPDGAPSSLYAGCDHDAYMASMLSQTVDFLANKRRNGRFGIAGKLKRPIFGPFRRLPA